MARVRVGCSGWVYPDWREPVYAGTPQRRWFDLYARRFDTVEINATFYGGRATNSSARAGSELVLSGNLPA
jgi:uncharacterized protein YecE (DUF72 family)